LVAISFITIANRFSPAMNLSNPFFWSTSLGGGFVVQKSSTRPKSLVRRLSNIVKYIAVPRMALRGGAHGGPAPSEIAGRTYANTLTIW
jgi:hypothetical protein